MIERKFISQNVKEFQIQEYIKRHLPRVGHSYTKLVRTPLGEKIVICASRPGLVIGKDGGTITKLTKDLKEQFKLENPQIELIEVESPHLDANIVAEMIANSLEQFGSSRFKGVAHKALSNVMNAGAIGIEILIGGKVPSARAKSWRFYQGYIKKCGDVALTGVQHAYASAQLKTGTIGIQVRLMPPTTKLPDDITIKASEGVKSSTADVLASEKPVMEEADETPSPITSAATQEEVDKPKKKAKSKKSESAHSESETQTSKKENDKPEKKEKKPRAKPKATAPEAN
jgi:small subunit ribosomal protein S3